MAGKKYVVHNIFWKAGGLNVNILELKNIEDVEDHLTYFSTNKGVITKSSYESWLINNFVLNSSQIATVFLENAFSVYDNISALSSDLIRILYDINPLLKPENVVINDNNVLKSAFNKDEDGRPLMANVAWNKEKPTSAPASIIPGIDNTLIYMSNPNLMHEEGHLPDPYEYDNIWWDRLTKYVIVKKFKKQDVIQLVGGKVFDRKDKYQAYIIARCINEFDKLIAEVDLSGMSKNVDSSVLIEELYNLVVKTNPFLEFESIDFDDVAKKYQPPKTNLPFLGGLPLPGTEETGKQEKVKPKRIFTKEDLKKLTDLDTRMLARVIGQDSAVKTIVDSVVRSAAGLKEDNKPISSLFFAGPTGIGKTYSVKVLAEELHVPMLTIDCSEYSLDHEYAKLIGSPPGYVGFDRGGRLTNFAREYPYSVILFDEIEKASPKVFDVLLQIMEEACITDGQGDTVNLKDAVVVYTSNIGVEEIKQSVKEIGFGVDRDLTDSKKNAALDRALTKTFKPEFINRLDEVVYFRLLNKDDYMKIIDLLLKELNVLSSRKKKIELTFSSKVKDFIYKEGIDDRYGARPLGRCIKKNIVTPLSTKIVKDDLRRADIKVKLERNKIKFDIAQRSEDEDFKFSTTTSGAVPANFSKSVQSL